MPKKLQSTTVERYKQLIIVLQELASILNTKLLLEHIVEEAVNLCDAEAAWILFPDQIHHTLVLDTGSLSNDIHYQGFSTPLNSSLEGWVYTNQQPIMINDSSLYDHRFGDFICLPSIEIKSLLGIPVIFKGESIGVLEVVNKQSTDFTQLDQEMLDSFACQVAIYIDNTRRFLQSDLVTELVHELHTPLAALNTALYLLQRSDLPDERRKQISQMIHNEFNRLTELTTSFLDYARMESGRTKFKPIQFDLTEVIIESVEIVQMQLDGKGMTISHDLPSEPLTITADKDKIKQVILNLLSNAVKYNRPGGIITVTASATPTDLSFSIRDNGQGIPPENLQQLFERFYRVPNTERGAKGTGLGLTICKKIVEAHNGKIEVSSTVGQGSTFIVQLPTNQER
jgi:signal transduction histidine kinase